MFNMKLKREGRGSKKAGYSGLYPDIKDMFALFAAVVSILWPLLFVLFVVMLAFSMFVG
jgi:hypothetical protein